MKILILSAYDAASHRRWRNALVNSLGEHDWTCLVLPARHFSWRVRGNSLYWAFEQRDVLSQRYDLVIATSMVDLSSLRGFVPSLCQCPTLVYFHENQFAYPRSDRQVYALEPQVTSLYCALASDKVVFNSEFNRDTFFQGAKALLHRLPDYVPAGVLDSLAARASVIPVPLESHCFETDADGVLTGSAVAHEISSERYSHEGFAQLMTKTHNASQQNSDIHDLASSDSTVLSLIWNHRWEYDKSPERLFAAIKRVLEQGEQIRLYIVGQQFRRQPEVFDQMRVFLQAQYPAVLKQWGFVASEHHYRSLLAIADVVLSTALHDFQGLAVLEAVAAGCVPLLPNRLCYPYWFDQRYLYDSFIDDPAREADVLAESIRQLAQLKRRQQMPLAPSVAQFSASSLKRDYQRVFLQTIDQHSQRSIEPVS